VPLLGVLFEAYWAVVSQCVCVSLCVSVCLWVSCAFSESVLYVLCVLCVRLCVSLRVSVGTCVSLRVSACPCACFRASLFVYVSMGLGGRCLLGVVGFNTDFLSLSCLRGLCWLSAPQTMTKQYPFAMSHTQLGSSSRRGRIWLLGAGV